MMGVVAGGFCVRCVLGATGGTGGRGTQGGACINC
jgi:hypothetical protein